jgi:hypothetical protein
VVLVEEFVELLEHVGVLGDVLFEVGARTKVAAGARQKDHPYVWIRCSLGECVDEPAIRLVREGIARLGARDRHEGGSSYTLDRDVCHGPRRSTHAFRAPSIRA